LKFHVLLNSILGKRRESIKSKTDKTKETMFGKVKQREQNKLDNRRSDEKLRK